MALPFEVVSEGESLAQGADVAPLTVVPRDGADLTLEMLMRQALEVPGAAAALLEAFAAQSRALRMVQEADARGATRLPSDLRHRLAAAAASTPGWLVAGGGGVRA